MKLLNSTKCKCGEEMKNEPFDKFIPLKLDDGFYGGRIGMTGEKECKCGRKLKGYFGTANGLELIDLEILSDKVKGKKDNT